MFIVLNPTWRCDLADKVGKCPYCPNLVSEDGKRVEFYWGLGTNEVKAEATVKQWLSFFSKLPPSFIDICGGEPLYWSGLPELVEGLPKGFTWGITSNCFAPDVIKNLDLTRCKSWTASFHPYAIGKADYGNRFFESLRILVYRHIDTRVTIMGFPGNLDWLPFWVEAFKGWNFRASVQPYESPKYAWGDHPDKLAALMELKGQISKERFPIWDTSPSNKLCLAGFDYIMTAPDGAVYRCNMALISGAKSMGSIFDAPGFLLKEPSLCELACSSSCDRERRDIAKDVVGLL